MKSNVYWAHSHPHCPLPARAEAWIQVGDFTISSAATLFKLHLALCVILYHE